MRFSIIFILMLFLVQPTYAACINPDGVPGELMYNGNYDVFQGCTIRGWKALHAPGPYQPLPPEGCPETGQICTGVNAGMIYAGESNGHRLYIAADDAPTALGWGDYSASGMGFCTYSNPIEPSCGDGLTNTQALKDHASTFPAAEYCANLSAHGYDVGQWYLPSKHELNVIYQNLRAGKPEGTHNFQSAIYWSSSKTSYSTHRQNFAPNSGSTSHTNLDITHRVRCAAR